MNAAATILAMSAAQKMRTLDLPMSLLMLVMGIIFIAPGRTKDYKMVPFKFQPARGVEVGVNTAPGVDG